MIEVQDLVKEYRNGALTTQVLKGVSFKVAKGEFVAIMGASGAGKSTLMNILGGLDQPTRGQYRLDGQDMTAASDDQLARIRNRKIGFVFQQFHLLERADALKNVLLPLVYADEAADAESRAERALCDVGLGDRKHHRPGQLSGGQQQRVAIARAIVTSPAVLLADEPTGNLDDDSSDAILTLFQSLHREGRTVVMITHDRQVAERAQRVILLQDGRVMDDRSIALRGASQHGAGLGRHD